MFENVYWTYMQMSTYQVAFAYADLETWKLDCLRDQSRSKQVYVLTLIKAR